MALVAGLAQGLAQVFIHQNIISPIIALSLDFPDYLDNFHCLLITRRESI
jgi:hypothetical protein